MYDLISYESLPVYDSESNEFVGEVEIPVELQWMSQEFDNRMANIIRNKVESWFDIVRNMAKDEGIPDIKTEIFTDVKSITESIIEYATQKNIDLMARGRTGLKRFFMGSLANGGSTAYSLFCFTCKVGMNISQTEAPLRLVAKTCHSHSVVH